jgi:activating signal cointegrator complex subunit 3
LQKLIGHAVSDARLQKVAALSQRLYGLQPRNSGAALIVESHVNGTGDDLEFGADLAFQAPARFLVDTSLEDGELLGEESAAPLSMFHDGWYDHGDPGQNHSTTDGGNFDLSWLRDACDQIVGESTSQLSQDDLPMAICRVLDSDKPGEEVLVNSYYVRKLWMSVLAWQPNSYLLLSPF